MFNWRNFNLFFIKNKRKILNNKYFQYSKVIEYQNNIWKNKIIEKELKRIEKIRQENIYAPKEKEDLKNLDSNIFKLICPVCDKPNVILLNHLECTSCGFPLSLQDIKKIQENIFLNIINNKNNEHKILYRDNDILIFEDKFKIADYHFDAIPIQEIKNIKELTFQHILLIQKMYQKGIYILQQNNISLFKNKNIEDYIIAG
jgi:hypothetical protein